MKKRLAKLITLMLALVMVIGAVAGLNVFADGEAADVPAVNEALTVTNANLVYDEEIKIAFTVDGFADGETAGVVVYANEGDTEYAFATSDLQTDKNGVEYFTTYGFAAKDFDVTIYVAAAKFVDGEVVEVGAKVAYSVTQYANDRLTNDAANLTEEQANLYEKIIAYNNAANAVLPQ